MRTPREIYLQKHSVTGRKLDQIRREVLRGEFPPRRLAAAPPRRLWRFWAEVIVPSRGWLAAALPVWALIALLNWPGTGGPRSVKPEVRPQEVAIYLREQKQFLLLLDDFFPSSAPRAASPKPRPRSARPGDWREA